MKKKTELETIERKGKALINDLPSIDNLRELATNSHKIAVASFKNGEVSFTEVEYGFTKNGYDKILKIQREYIRNLITITSECNCSGIARKGDTAMTLPNESEHLSWCDQAKEFERKFQELKEKYP